MALRPTLREWSAIVATPPGPHRSTGCFFLRVGVGNDEVAKRFRGIRQQGEYLRSVYLRKQDAPPLGVNAKGLISPIRPQFNAYYSDLRQTGQPATENVMVSAQWKAFFPHTIRRGTPMCDACHDNARRFLYEKEDDRIYRIDLDGLGLSSFWNQQGQTVINGSFVGPERYSEIINKNSDYTKAYVEKWKQLIESGDASSRE